MNDRRVPLLANDYVTLYESPAPGRVSCYSPGLAVLPGGRLVATLDLGGTGVAALPSAGPKHTGERGFAWFGKIFTSDDAGRTWTHRADFPFMHARPFVAGRRVYVLGHAGDLMVTASDDGGETWSPAARLTKGQRWHQSACNVLHANGCVYLAMERQTADTGDWPVSVLAPVLMRARETDDLTRRENWTFASEVVYRDLVPDDDTIGLPFWTPGSTYTRHGETRRVSPPGWLETNVVQFTDPAHLWHDPTGRTFHLWMRAFTGGTGYAAILRVTEDADGAMTTTPVTAPSGRRLTHLPCPGGHLRFHVLHDAVTGLFWLVSSLGRDSMRRPDDLPPTRYDLPYNERDTLALHFSTNMVDWRMAGVIAHGDGPKEARHYASAVIRGDDLLVLSRSGDARAKSAHDGNLITLHTVERFRDLAY